MTLPATLKPQQRRSSRRVCPTPCCCCHKTSSHWWRSVRDPQVDSRYTLSVLLIKGMWGGSFALPACLPPASPCAGRQDVNFSTALSFMRICGYHRPAPRGGTQVLLDRARSCAKTLTRDCLAAPWTLSW